MGRQVHHTLRVSLSRGLRPAASVLLLYVGSASAGLAQGYTYAGTSNNADPYAYLSDLNGQPSSNGVVVNQGALDALLMPNGTYPRSYGPSRITGGDLQMDGSTMVIGGDPLVETSSVDSMGNPVSRSYLPGGNPSIGAPMAVLPSAAPVARRPAPTQRAEERPAPMRAAAVEPTRITVPDPEPLTPEPMRATPAPKARTEVAAAIEPPPPSPVAEQPVAKAEPKPAEAKAPEAKAPEPKAAPPVRLSAGQGPIRLSAGVGPIRTPETDPTPEKSPIAAAAPAPAKPQIAPSTAKSAPPPAPAQSPRKPEASPGITPPPETPALTPPPAPPVAKASPEATPAPKAETQVATRTTPDIQTDGTVTLSFTAGAPDLPAGSENALNRVAEILSKDSGRRVRILSYANADGGNANQAKRLSLTRALNVRAYLMDQGVRSPNIEVRAMGDQGAGSNPDRVDVSMTP
ncbi:MAG: OmpA family protein [Rhodospirillum sp.]|nr:OmpA family protein [Rhodospirillum sp.]MCF8491123.1 OmpA family protein [Rhodospirillum sp.]MCF8501655.1 OmpA family protein [Rhodospirillum sp.]